MYNTKNLSLFSALLLSFISGMTYASEGTSGQREFIVYANYRVKGEKISTPVYLPAGEQVEGSTIIARCTEAMQKNDPTFKPDNYEIKLHALDIDVEPKGTYNTMQFVTMTTMRVQLKPKNT